MIVEDQKAKPKGIQVPMCMSGVPALKKNQYQEYHLPGGVPVYIHRIMQMGDLGSRVEEEYEYAVTMHASLNFAIRQNS